MKKCSKCKALKDESLFTNDSRYLDKKYPSCKECKKKVQQADYAINSEVIIQRDVARKMKKYHSDPVYRIKHQLRSRLRIALSKQYSSGVAVEYLGCSIEELRKHLESQFLPGMTWENNTINGWHIDHIKSLNNFDLTNLEEIKEACRYTNLQPLWAEDNWSKR